MRDTGFTPHRGKRLGDEVRSVWHGAIEHGSAIHAVRWLMLAAPFTGGVSIFAFYAMQPYLLQLYGNERAYTIAGLAAAIVAGAQIAGGTLVPFLGRVFRRRTTVRSGARRGRGDARDDRDPAASWTVLALSVWGLMFAAVTPVRQAYLNSLIASRERATVFSFDNLLDPGAPSEFSPRSARQPTSGDIRPPTSAAG